MSQETKSAEARFLDAVEFAIADGVAYDTMADMIGGIHDAGHYSTNDVAQKVRAEIAADSLRLFKPESSEVLTTIYKKFELGGWESTAELLASLAFAIDFIAHMHGEENAIETLNLKHVGGPYPQVAI